MSDMITAPSPAAIGEAKLVPAPKTYVTSPAHCGMAVAAQAEMIRSDNTLPCTSSPPGANTSTPGNPTFEYDAMRSKSIWSTGAVAPTETTPEISAGISITCGPAVERFTALLPAAATGSVPCWIAKLIARLSASTICFYDTATTE